MVCASPPAVRRPRSRYAALQAPSQCPYAAISVDAVGALPTPAARLARIEGAPRPASAVCRHARYIRPVGAVTPQVSRAALECLERRFSPVAVGRGMNAPHVRGEHDVQIRFVAVLEQSMIVRWFEQNRPRGCERPCDTPAVYKGSTKPCERPMREKITAVAPQGPPAYLLPRQIGRHDDALVPTLSARDIAVAALVPIRRDDPSARSSTARRLSESIWAVARQSLTARPGSWSSSGGPGWGRVAAAAMRLDRCARHATPSPRG
jgi:hypothetical protein